VSFAAITLCVASQRIIIIIIIIINFIIIIIIISVVMAVRKLLDIPSYIE